MLGWSEILTMNEWMDSRKTGHQYCTSLLKQMRQTVSAENGVTPAGTCHYYKQVNTHVKIDKVI